MRLVAYGSELCLVAYVSELCLVEYGPELRLVAYGSELRLVAYGSELRLVVYGSGLLTVQFKNIFTFMYIHLTISQDFDHGYIPRMCNFEVTFIINGKNYSPPPPYHIGYNIKDKSGKQYVIAQWRAEEFCSWVFN
jgi:hypothetical protein